MAANTNPIYALTPNVGIATDIIAANTTLDLTTGTSYALFTAGANGSWVKDIIIKANPVNNTAASVARIWLTNGNGLGSSANTTLIKEVTLSAVTATQIAATAEFNIAINRAIPAGWKLYITLGTAPGGSGEFTATCFGGDY